MSAATSSASSGVAAGSSTAATSSLGAAAAIAATVEAEWVEIIEPRTQEHMFANLTTGECVWDPPVGVPVKKTNDNQWWELFDQNTARFYYYNASSQKTVWHRPANCDIIPLAKLQTLKQNTEVRGLDEKRHNSSSRRTVSTETPPDSSFKLKQLVLNGDNNGLLLGTRTTKLTHSQTSSADSPRAVRRFRHRRTESAELSGLRSEPPQSPSEEFRLLRGATTVYASPQKHLPTSQRFSTEDSRRTAPTPAQAKYYSIPHQQSPSAKYAVPLTSNNHHHEYGNNSISRSVSFMSRQQQPPVRGASSSEEPPYGWRSSFDSGGGRRSVESTPQSNRRLKDSGSSPENQYSPQQQSSPLNRSTEVGSPIEGYCTPMVNRKGGGVLRSQASHHSPLKEQLSISQLVDSGLSALTDGEVQPSSQRLGGSSNNGNKHRPAAVAKLRRGNGTLERGNSKMSPLQQYILEQAKMSGYRFGGGDVDSGDRDSYVESEEDLQRHDESDDFADDEEDFGGGESDELSKASSVDGDDDRYLSEPTYNNLDPVWLQSVHGYQFKGPQQQQQQQPDVDAFSEEFDIRMRFSSSHKVSTMPRPASHQPTSSLQQQQYLQNPAFPVPYDVLHPSLPRNTHIASAATDNSLRRGSSSHSRATSVLSSMHSLHSTVSCESDIEKYAQGNLNVQKRGLFRKKMTVKDILTHTRENIRKPLTCLRDKAAKKEAIEVFRLVQIYMGDRRAKQGMTINSVALDIATRGYSIPALRDELYVQLCKQTTENVNSRESLRRGWELMSLCLTFFPPSPTFEPALHSYIQRHRCEFEYPDVGKWPVHVQVSHYAGICARRLDRIGSEKGRLAPKKPTSEEIDQSRLQIFRPSMFGGTLQEAMEIQRDRFPQRRLPWILTTLAEQVMQLNGTGTEGIFRVPADLDEVNSVKNRFDQWEVPPCADCHTASSLLKLWFRELYEPLIPDDLYEECVRIGDDAGRLHEVVDKMPDLNRDVMMFLVRFLQYFARPDVVAVTKMDGSNLGTVFAPNCLRCPSQDPVVILENTRKEMAFVKNLILNLDTASAEGLL